MQILIFVGRGGGLETFLDCKLSSQNDALYLIHTVSNFLR